MKLPHRKLYRAYDPARELTTLVVCVSIALSIIFGLLIIIIQRIFCPIVLLRISPLNSIHFGHMLLEIDWYLSQKRIKRFDFFFFTSVKKVNSYLEKIIRDKVKVTPRVLLFGAYLFNRMLPGGAKYIINLPSESYNFEVFDQSPTQFALSSEEEKIGLTVLANLNISPDQKIVCMYVRDEAYSRVRFPKIDQNFSSYRNSNFVDFTESIKYLISQGYVVIRMGRIAKNQIDFRSPNFIDYCFSENQSDFADFYLTYRSEFAICTDTGMTHLPLFMRKPIGLVNISGMHGLLHTKLVKFITLKKYIIAGSNLTLSEIFENNLDKLSDFTEFRDKGIKFIDSEPSELLGITVDMHNECTSKSPEAMDEYSKKFHEILARYREIPFHSKVSKVWASNNLEFLND